ncbi:MAG: hypothetical protein FWH57_02095 [Oscillospiraceae bacterium]|nr:hypothetical protein [Oscillospiraceae bacterium]
MTSDGIPIAQDIDEFKEIFSDKEREKQLPFIYKDSLAFSVLGCHCEEYWVFYIGSYKAYLEEYITFLHFEKLLAKTMSNPLSNAIKLGLFG